jgi:ADP-ribose pyrophosphatase
MTEPLPFAVTSSRIAYANPWLRIREDRLLRPDGTPGLYGVIERRDFAVVVAVQDGRLTLVQQYRHPVGERLWEFPQGVSEPDDPDLLACAARELREETGLVAARLEDCGRVYLAAGICTQAYSVVLATGLARGATAREATEADLVARDMPLAEVERMLREGVIRDATSLAAFGLLRLQGRL